MPHWRGSGAYLGLGSSRPSEGKIMGIVGIETWAWCRHQVWRSDISVCSVRCTGHGMSMGRQQECARKTSGQMRQTCERASHIASWLNKWWFLFCFFFFYDERSSVKIAFHQHLWCNRQGTRYRGSHCELDRPTHCPWNLCGTQVHGVCDGGRIQHAVGMCSEEQVQEEFPLEGVFWWEGGWQLLRVGGEGNPVPVAAAPTVAIQKGGRCTAPGNSGCSPGLGPHGLCLGRASSLLWRCLDFIPLQSGSYRLNTAGIWQDTLKNSSGLKGENGLGWWRSCCRTRDDGRIGAGSRPGAEADQLWPGGQKKAKNPTELWTVDRGETQKSLLMGSVLWCCIL